MKQKLFLLPPTVFLATHLFAQVKTVRPLAQKTLVTTSAVKLVTNPKPAKTENPPPKPTDLQNAVVNIVVGDDGKDYDTKLSVIVNDDNKRMAGYYGIPSHDIYGNPNIAGTSMGEYFPGDNETVPVTLEASVPTGQMNTTKYPPLPVVREANVSDFANGGSSANNFSIYNEESLTVTIDKISSTRISGTFSGTMRLSDDSRGKDYKNSVAVTDGKFDIPFSTGNIRPE